MTSYYHHVLCGEDNSLEAKGVRLKLAFNTAIVCVSCEHKKNKDAELNKNKVM